MRAMSVSAFGGPEQLLEVSVPDPEPGAGGCLIGVEACDVLWLDAMLRAGLGEGPIAPELPWIPGNGVAGRVLAVGAGVDEAWIGRRVGAHTGNHGGYAERAAVLADDVVAIPDGVAVPTAAALLHDGPTALELLEVTRVTAGESVLVLGASGGLGLTLIQLARHRGAQVVAVARDEAKRGRIAAPRPRPSSMATTRIGSRRRTPRSVPRAPT